MLLTEVEAKKKWCPYARGTAGDNRAFIETDAGAPPADRCCIASVCMAWRWGEVVPQQRKTNHEKRTASTPLGWWAADVPASWQWVPYDGEERAHWLEPVTEAEARRRGHCGAFLAPTFQG
jgi:hypothetical protein